jgi:hypothetical protein
MVENKIKIEWIKLSTTVISAVLSAIIIGTLWYASINMKIQIAEENIRNNKMLFDNHCIQADARSAAITEQINKYRVDSAVSQALLKEIALRLDRIERSLDTMGPKK